MWRRPLTWVATAIIVVILLVSGFFGRIHLLSLREDAAASRLFALGAKCRDYQLKTKVDRGPWQQWLEGRHVWIEIDEAEDVKAVLAEARSFRVLRALNLSNSQLSAEDFDVISKLSRVELLSLQGTNVSSPDIARLGQMPCLETLDLQFTPIDDKCLISLGNFKRLGILSLLYTDLTEKAVKDWSYRHPHVEVTWRPNEFANTALMEELTAHNISMKVVRPEGISSYPDWDLNLEEEPAAEAWPLLEQLQNVRSVTTWASFGDKDISRLLKWRSLRKVDLTLASVTPSGVLLLKDLPLLERVDLTTEYVASWTDEDWAELKLRFPRVEFHTED